MRCWRSSEIACPSHRRSIHSETSQLRYMLGSRPQVTHVHAPFFHFFCVTYDSVFRTTILQNFIFPQWKLDGCRIEERTRKNSFANGILKRRMPLVTVSLFILVSETITESRISATKFLTRLETRLDSLRHGLVPVNCYFYRERWLLFHRANHQKLAQFIIRIPWWGRLLFARPPLGQKSAETLHTFPSLRFPNFFSRPLLIAHLLHGSGTFRLSWRKVDPRNRIENGTKNARARGGNRTSNWNSDSFRIYIFVLVTFYLMKRERLLLKPGKNTWRMRKTNRIRDSGSRF